MMREILFRAKRYSGEWVYGYYAHQFGAHQILSRDGDEYQRESYHINPETVGQYTGLTDKNGNKVFEGDIVEYEGKRYSINYLPHYARFAAVKPNTVFSVFAYQRGEVIGNIHDNPELIGGDE